MALQAKPARWDVDKGQWTSYGRYYYKSFDTDHHNDRPHVGWQPNTLSSRIKNDSDSDSDHETYEQTIERLTSKYPEQYRSGFFNSYCSLCRKEPVWGRWSSEPSERFISECKKCKCPRCQKPSAKGKICEVCDPSLMNQIDHCCVIL